MSKDDISLRLGESPGAEFSQAKSLTSRRSRKVIAIEALLDRHRGQIKELMAADPGALRKFARNWAAAPSEVARVEAFQVGQHVLFFPPGAALEGAESLGQKRISDQARVLIKLVHAGTVLHLCCLQQTDGSIEWTWQSLEALHGDVRAEALRTLQFCVAEFVEQDLPRLLKQLNA